MRFTERDSVTAKASLELLYHISRELVSALDLRTVLERVLSLSMENVGAINGSLIVMDDGGEAVEAVIVTGGQIHPHATEQLSVTLEHGLAGWVARHRQAVLIADTSQDERWLRRPDDSASQTGAKSAVSAPILARERLIGVMTLVHPRPGNFTRDHLALVQAIADQAGIAILNARLYAESQRQARVMTAVAESAIAITASLNLDEVLQRILDQISQALQVDEVSLALIDPSGQNLEYRASTNKGEHSIIGMRLPVEKGIAGWVVRTGQGVVAQDAYKDPRFYPEVDQLTGFQTKAIVCAPIRLHGRVIGVIQALNPIRGAFDPDALLVLTGVGSLAGSAIHHAQLFEQLQAAHRRYRELFEDSVDPIFITDTSGRLLEANRQAQEMTGLSGEDFGRVSIQDFGVVREDLFGLESLASGETITYEAVLHLDDRDDIPVQVYVRQVNIDDVLQLQWLLRDITERKNLDSLREDLISMIYHDLRSPLANIVSSLDVLESMLPAEGERELKPLVSIASRSTERIQRLTDSLLDMNHLEAGQPIGNRQFIDPAEVCRDALEAVRTTAKSKDIHIVLRLEPNLPSIWVDGDMIRRVMINLLENAVKYTPNHSQVEAGARAEGDYVHLWVKDNGPGIPPASQAVIFDKFARLATKEGTRGFGLGLAYCRLAVLGHGGKIWVESEPGAGATFNFTLPINTETGGE